MGTNGELTVQSRALEAAEQVVSMVDINSVCSFMDTCVTSMGRATHYNTREEQQAAELASHDAVLGSHRGLYTALLTLPGLTDRSRQVGLKKLLSTPHDGNSLVSPALEREVIYRLFQDLPPQRMLKIIDGFRVGNKELGLKKANNARTRKLILRTLLSSPRFALWCVKYRTKVRRALKHAWGKRRADTVRSILSKSSYTQKELGILTKCIHKFTEIDQTESVAFALGAAWPRGWNHPLFQAFENAKVQLDLGSRLPTEVLEGIRGQYHKDDFTKEDVLELTKGSMTKTQKRQVQKRAKAAGVEVSMDPLDYEPVELYIYAFENGASSELQEALQEKARVAAQKFPIRYERVGILVDASASMAGDKTQKLRPLAATLALRDMLSFVGQDTFIQYAGGIGDMSLVPGSLIQPQGDTELAEGFVRLLEDKPDAVFVLSDGYENAPSGRFAEVFQAVREIGVNTPVYHLNPVFAAEAKGVRDLAPGVPVMPAKDPASLATTMLRGILAADPVKGLAVLLEKTILPANMAVRNRVSSPRPSFSSTMKLEREVRT